MPGLETSDLAAFGQVNVQTRAEADQAEPLYGAYRLAFRTNETIRRATRPAIWTTPIRPFVVEMTSEFRSSLAGLVEFGIDEGARPVPIRSMRPATGLRFTWQLYTLMKIEMRGSGRSRDRVRPRDTCAIIETCPSAGDTTMPSHGVTRTGSRKKARTRSSEVADPAQGVQIQNRIRLTAQSRR